MNVGISNNIVAIVTINRDIVSSNMSVFYVKDREELKYKAKLVARCVNGAVHDVGDDTLIIVNH